ncbi:hypothetical protein ATG_13100 [Desulfurococcaceae archaeon AG1]|nr:hypothetical protein ATG_13100 [Desulfurococcaceae archaeon AG1]
MSCVGQPRGYDVTRDRRQQCYGIGRRTGVCDKVGNIVYIKYEPQGGKTLRLTYRVSVKSNGNCSFTGFSINRLAVYVLSDISQLMRALSTLLTISLMLELIRGVKE